MFTRQQLNMYCLSIYIACTVLVFGRSSGHYFWTASFREVQYVYCKCRCTYTQINQPATSSSILPNMQVEHTRFMKQDWNQVEHTRLKATRLLHSEIFAPSYISATCTFTFQARTQQFLMISSYAHYYQLLSWEPSDWMIDFTEYPCKPIGKQPSATRW